MARGINKVILVGNCGKDPEVRYMPSGGAVANISVATSESWKDKDGQQQDRTEWHRVVFYNKLAEIVGQYVKKGSKLYIEGSLRTSQYEKDGVTRYSTDIICRDMQMLDSRGDNMSASQPVQNTQANAAPAQAATPNTDQSFQEGFDDDIPF